MPLLLALVGVALIIAGQLDLDQPGVGGGSLPPIPEPSATPVASVEPSPTVGGSPLPSATPSPTPHLTSIAVQIQIASVGINLPIRKPSSSSECDFPLEFDAWLLCGSSWPGRGTNTYIFGHAVRGIFLPLWNVKLGNEVKILMSDRKVLVYRITEIHPNVSCPDSREPNMPAGLEPLALKYAAPGCGQGAFWTAPTDHERLTLQTSQGFNRNWGEFIVVADPVGWG